MRMMTMLVQWYDNSDGNDEDDDDAGTVIWQYFSDGNDDYDCW